MNETQVTENAILKRDDTKALAVIRQSFIQEAMTSGGFPRAKGDLEKIAIALAANLIESQWGMRDLNWNKAFTMKHDSGQALFARPAESWKVPITVVVFPID